jgi:hypothetical protein
MELYVVYLAIDRQVNDHGAFPPLWFFPSEAQTASFAAREGLRDRKAIGGWAAESRNMSKPPNKVYEKER